MLPRASFLWLCIVAVLLAVCAAAQAQTAVGVVGSPAGSANAHYVGNRAPLLPSPLVKLPPGKVRPEGWLRKQLELMADGFTGRLPELSGFCKFEGNAWVSPTGEGHSGWEEVPYWLKGYGDLGYVLGDKRVIDEARKWIEGILSNTRPDGYFGPESNRKAMDLWPNMPALFALRSYYEYTGDKRVLTLMTNYFRWMSAVPLEQIFPGSWQKIRGGDNLDSIYWLYNRTGDQWLLGLARVNHERTADWVSGVASWHGVNVCQDFREPAVYYQQTRDERYLKCAERNYETAMGMYGQVPGGMFGADENAREGHNGPRQAAETCSMVEFMFSHEKLASITGSTLWADRCEEVAFNSLPASMTPDLKGLHYLTAPNMVQLDKENKAPMIENAGEMLSYNPHSYRCCQHNVAMGWPYFAEHLWMATPGNGLAAVLYAPCKVTARVAGGVDVSIAEETDYPFGDTVALEVSTPKPVSFPLYLRIPAWCWRLKLEINSTVFKTKFGSNGWLKIERKWQSGDTVKLTLPMDIKLKTWPANRNTVSVYRGPLAYSLKIGERWQRYGGTDQWPATEVYPTTPWNYGLLYNSGNLPGSFRVVRNPAPLAAQPFTPEAAPIALKAKGKRIPKWKQEANGLIGEVQPGPIKSDEPEEEITLIPMGCARLRVSAFPRIGDGPGAKEWSSTTLSASHIWNSLSAANDGVLPSSSSDLTIPRFTWWDHRGTSEWLQYDFDTAQTFSWCEVYWYDDTPTGGHCRLPATWRLMWWDTSVGWWVPVPDVTQYPGEPDRMNRVEFPSVTTDKLRLDVQLKPSFSGGVLEWRVGK